MDGGYTMKSVLSGVLDNLLSAVVDFVPRALTAIAVIIIGIILAKLAERIVRSSFDRLRLHDALDRMAVSQILTKLGLRDTTGRIPSRTIYFLLIVLFTQSVTRAVGLDAIADAIGSFFSYLPSLVAAFLVLLLGMVVAQFLGRTVTRSAEESGMDTATVLGRAVSGFIMFVVVIMAISQLQIDTEVIRMVVLVVLAGFSAALALSFGLGTRSVTRNLVAGFYIRGQFRIGDTLEVGGQRGIIASVRSIQTLIERDGETIAIPNQVFLDQAARTSS